MDRINSTFGPPPTPFITPRTPGEGEEKRKHDEHHQEQNSSKEPPPPPTERPVESPDDAGVKGVHLDIQA